MICRLCCSQLALVLVSLCPAVASADISTTGDVSPDPATTTLDDNLFIRGTMTVDAQSDVLSKQGFIGRRSNDVSVATVTGFLSTWTNSEGLILGFGGSDATLNILDAGVVSSLNGEIYDGDQVFVNDAGSRWDLADSLQLTGGSLHITTRARVTTGGNVEIGQTPFGSSTLNAIQRTSTVNVDGVAGQLRAGGQLDVGSFISSYGDVDYGVLNLTNQAQVIVGEDTWVGRLDDTGTINFDDGQLFTNGLFASAANLTGVGMIDTNGVVSDLDLIFNQTQGLQQQVVLADLPGQSITFNLDIDGTAVHGAGFYGDGSIEIREGISLRSIEGVLAYHEGSSATAAIDGTGSAWDLPSDLRIGRDGNAEMTVSAGGAISAGGRITVAELKSATASLTVTGANSTVQANELIVGQIGQGELHILDGASFMVDSDMWVAMSRDNLSPSLRGQGAVVIDGPGSELTIGGHLLLRWWGEAARIDVTNGGLLQAATAELRDTVVIDGANSQMNITGHLAGSDLLHIQNGATASSDSFTTSGLSYLSGQGTQLDVTGHSVISSDYFAVSEQAVYTTGSLNHSQGLLRVTGTDTLLDIAGDLTLTSSSLQVLSGGTLRNANATIDGTSSAVIRVGKLWSIGGDLRIGETGNASVTQYSGTVEILSGDLILSRYDPPAPAPVTAEPSPSGLVISHFLEPPAGTGVYHLFGGVLDMHGNDILIGEGQATFLFTGGELRDLGTFDGTLQQDGGTLAPGNPPGTTTVTQDYNLNAGTLAIELAGLTAGTEHDKVIVAGALNLGATSTLDITLIDGFTPGAGDSFDLFDFASLTGTFDVVNLPTLGTGLFWDDSQLYTDGSLSVIFQLLMGDADGDGDVDALDITAVRNNFGNTGAADGSLLGDADHDGDVDAFDLTAVELNFGSRLPQSEASTANPIPEPTSLALIGLGGLLLSSRRCLGSAT